MKLITFGRRWRRRIDEATVEEYPAGASVTVSNERAVMAQRAGVLDGDPVDAPTGDADDQTQA